MIRLQILSPCLVIFGLVVGPSFKADEPVKIQGHAIVRTLKGKATYTSHKGITQKLKLNAELAPGDTISTGPDSFAYIHVNGLTSWLRLASKTALVLEQMDRTGSARTGSSVTKLDLKVGSIIGQVKKVTGDSKYEIITPHGVVGIRGTDFAVDVGPLSGGRIAATFTCLNGQVVVSATVDGKLQNKTLDGVQSWTPGSGDPQPWPMERLQSYANLLWHPFAPPAPPPAPPKPITILPVFPSGAAPLGPSRPPR